MGSLKSDYKEVYSVKKDQKKQREHLENSSRKQVSNQPRREIKKGLRSDSSRNNSKSNFKKEGGGK